MSVTVYSKPACVQCTATTRALDKQGIAYTKIDVTVDPAAADRVRELGYAQLPVVATADDHWSGYRPDRIARIAAGAASSMTGSASAAV